MQFVRYVGLAHERVISADDWRRAGITDMETVVWTHHNGFTVPFDRFTDEAVRVAIEGDPSFIVVGGEPRDMMRGERTPMTPQQLFGPRVDMNAAAGVTNAAPVGSGALATPPGSMTAPTNTGAGASGTD